MTTVYLFDQKYKLEAFKDITKLDNSEINELLSKKVIINDGRDGKEDLKLFVQEEGTITPKFVGIFYIDDFRIVSLPNYLSEGLLLSNIGENKKYKMEEAEKQLIEIFNKYSAELSTRDGLFSYSTKFCKGMIVSENLFELYREYGPYTQKYRKIQNKRGRISWAHTVKSKMPILINDNVPVYTDFLYQQLEDKETEITKIERSIINEYFSFNDMVEDSELYTKVDFENQYEYFKNIVNNEISMVFDEIKLKRLELIKDFFNCIIVYKEKNVKQEIQTMGTTNIYAIAKYSYVFEVLLAKYFANDRGIGLKDGTATYKSSFLEKEVKDMNDPCYRPYLYDMGLNEKYKNENNYKENYNKHTNYIDVAYDDKYEDKYKSRYYCMIIDAKAYGGILRNNTFVQNLPDKDSILKQFYYEDVMERVYKKNSEKISNYIRRIECYNVFILPIHKGKEANEEIEGVFAVYGKIRDEMRKRRILVVRADMDKLINACLDDDVNDYSARRNSFYKMIDEEKEDEYKHIIELPIE